MHVEFFRHASRNRSLFVKLDVEVVGLRRQNVHALGHRVLVDDPDFQDIQFADLKAGKFH